MTSMIFFLTCGLLASASASGEAKKQDKRGIISEWGHGSHAYESGTRKKDMVSTTTQRGPLSGQRFGIKDTAVDIGSNVHYGSGAKLMPGYPRSDTGEMTAYQEVYGPAYVLNGHVVSSHVTASDRAGVAGPRSLPVSAGRWEVAPTIPVTMTVPVPVEHSVTVPIAGLVPVSEAVTLEHLRPAPVTELSSEAVPIISKITVPVDHAVPVTIASQHMSSPLYGYEEILTTVLGPGHGSLSTNRSEESIALIKYLVGQTNGQSGNRFVGSTGSSVFGQSGHVQGSGSNKLVSSFNSGFTGKGDNSGLTKFVSGGVPGSGGNGVLSSYSSEHSSRLNGNGKVEGLTKYLSSLGSFATGTGLNRYASGLGNMPGNEHVEGFDKYVSKLNSGIAELEQSSGLNKYISKLSSGQNTEHNKYALGLVGKPDNSDLSNYFSGLSSGSRVSGLSGGLSSYASGLGSAFAGNPLSNGINKYVSKLSNVLVENGQGSEFNKFMKEIKENVDLKKYLSGLSSGVSSSVEGGGLNSHSTGLRRKLNDGKDIGLNRYSSMFQSKQTGLGQSGGMDKYISGLGGVMDSYTLEQGSSHAENGKGGELNKYLSLLGIGLTGNGQGGDANKLLSGLTGSELEGLLNTFGVGSKEDVQTSRLNKYFSGLSGNKLVSGIKKYLSGVGASGQGTYGSGHGGTDTESGELNKYVTELNSAFANSGQVSGISKFLSGLGSTVSGLGFDGELNRYSSGSGPGHNCEHYGTGLSSILMSSESGSNNVHTASGLKPGKFELSGLIKSGANLFGKGISMIGSGLTNGLKESGIITGHSSSDASSDIGAGLGTVLYQPGLYSSMLGASNFGLGSESGSLLALKAAALAAIGH